MKKLSLLFGIVLLLLLQSCNNGNYITRFDTPTSGVAEIVVDECFAPIIQQQINVFEATNPEAVIYPTYTSEPEAFDLFMKDSIRLIIATRELTSNEAEIIRERKQNIRSKLLAIDGLALIVNKANSDTLISVNDIKKIMTGEIRSWKDLNPASKQGDIVVAFDSPNSSTVRYIKESICEGKALGNTLKAMAVDSFRTADLKDKTPNQRVIDYVGANPNAIGVIGVSWVSNPADTTTLSFINKINVMSVSNDAVATRANSIKPYAAFFSPQLPSANQYPLKREVYLIISDIMGGLPDGFVAFSAGEKGQRIIYKAGLYPGTIPTRLVQIKSSF